MILLTGTSGFVGTYLQKCLSHSGCQVNGLSLRNLQWGKEISKQVLAIIHLAGKAHDLKNVTNPKEYYEANYELTQQLFDAFLQSSATVFVFMSSVKAAADEVADILIEEVAANPQTHYGKSKLLAEQYIVSKDIPEGKRVYILRPCMIHGPGNKGNLNLLYKLVSKGIPWPLAAFENQRSFCSIDNVCYVVSQILEREDIPSGVYNLADDETLSTNELIEIIGATTNKKAKIISISKKVINTIAKIGDILHLPLNTERLDKLTENFVVSNLKIKAALGIEKLPVTSKEGILKTFQSFTK
jgi:nucleoside-diphosphate-sugar epimerase